MEEPTVYYVMLSVLDVPIRDACGQVHGAQHVCSVVDPSSGQILAMKAHHCLNELLVASAMADAFVTSGVPDVLRLDNDRFFWLPKAEALFDFAHSFDVRVEWGSQWDGHRKPIERRIRDASEQVQLTLDLISTMGGDGYCPDDLVIALQALVQRRAG